MLPDPSKRPKSERLRALLPDIWELVRPRRGILAIGMVLMAINRVSGLVLPASTKYLVDDIIGKREYYLLRTLILVVVGATIIQGIKIGASSIVGAGAVVIRDVPDAVTVAGVPAVLLTSRVASRP